MPVTLVIGAQWGDEGKGRIVDFLSRSAQVVARFGGGSNAGHTVRVGDKTYKLRIVPSGVVAGVDHCIIGPGTVVSAGGLVTELETLEFNGVDTSRVWVSDLAHLILPYHVEMDRTAERERGEDALGTTGNGIGPAYIDRAARTGIRAGELVDIRRARQLLFARTHAIRSQGIATDLDTVAAELGAQAERVVPHIRDTVTLLHEQLKAGKRVLAEGAQGSMLDVTFGTYPYVTSSVTIAGGALAGLGFGPTDVDHVIGVVKAYQTRVGGGPFPTELEDSLGEELRKRGAEFGVVTGRPRRCGWLDLVALRYAVQINGITHLAITKIDVLDSFYQISMCTGYEGGGDLSLPFQIAHGAKPQYETLPGWLKNTVTARSWEDLPYNAREYLKFIEDFVGVPVSYVSVGPERSQIVTRDAPIGGAVSAL
ncbi:MAG: adenylosuccinate synthase [Candidatus Eremiobacteraeota bacterium]|nr:adenylosuccinate synthase [Candidatus Eremiobacteraeota bacterium]MBV8596725.1 adenylosuccinate synthase [Candidatus Eremiobacteraeota bacterium]MBV8667759.1 adenylosuccinate synthase [Candidatus Eremiobacteraeota bacterium]